MNEITQKLALDILDKKISCCEQMLQTLPPFLTDEIDELVMEKNSYLQHRKRVLEGGT